MGRSISDVSLGIVPVALMGVVDTIHYFGNCKALVRIKQ